MVVWKLHMNEVARTATGRRHVQDGTFTVLLIVLAVVQGYVLLPATTTPSTAGVSMVVIEPPPRIGVHLLSPVRCELQALGQIHPALPLPSPTKVGQAATA